MLASVAVALALALAAAVPAALPAGATDVPSLSFTGECTFSPSLTTTPLTATWSPSLTAAPLSLSQPSSFLTISGDGSCAGVPLTNTIHLNLSGTILYSCDAGEGTISGSVSWSAGPSSKPAVVALVTGSLGTIQLVIRDTSLDVVAVADVTWAASDVLKCPGLGGTKLTGALWYAAG